MFNLNNVEVKDGFARLNPGEKVPVKLTKVEITEEGHLDFYFEGTDVNNPGSFKPRYWAEKFDMSSSTYNASLADNLLKQITRIIRAYLTDTEAAKVSGKSWMEFVGSIKMNLTPDKFKDVKTELKIIYQKGSDELISFPLYGSIISSSKRPVKLKLTTNTDDSGVPYQRVLPMSEYLKGTNESPMFSDTTEVDSSFPPLEEEEEELPWAKS